MKVMKKTHFIAATVAAISIAASGDIIEKYYRLAIRGIRGGDIVQLGEFSLYAADGSRVNGGGMKLVDQCEPKSLAPGECFASRKNFARETAEKLFDGNPKTKFCVGKLTLREDDPASWLYICFRLGDNAKPVAKYNFCSADDTDRFPDRNPTSWAIWCSSDGETWRLLDERTNAFSPKSMLTWWNGSRPYSFGGEKPCDDMAREVNPFIGAVTQHPRSALGGHGLGKTFPGAATPCGMIQLSPDTITGGDNGCGYSYHHETIEGFSFMHLSGVGWYGEFGNFQVMPTTGERILDREKAKSAYSHEREVAEAGYYAVTLDRYGIRAEMAAAPRAGILRFTFPESKEARVQIDLGRRVGQIGRWLKHSRQHVKVVDERTIEGRIECPWQDGGWGRGAGRVHYVVNYTCVFSKPFKKFGFSRAGNTEGIKVHTYGAHIFHTNNKEVWDYVNEYAVFNRFTNSPVANYKGELYSLPFNMYTFNKMWGVVTPEEAAAKIEEQKKEAGITEPKNLEEQAISLIGTDIYEKLVKGYTEKQWGRPCTELPAFIIKRLPVRLTFDNNYFNALYQGIPIGGYTRMVANMLEGVEIILEEDYLADKEKWNGMARKVVYTGPIDAYFGYELGYLEYRSVRFETELLDQPNFQGNAAVNYTDRETPWTRIIEHKWFEFGKDEEGNDLPKTVISREFSSEWEKGSDPYYPVNDQKNSDLYLKYKERADREEKVIFGGRLGEYKYYDMDQVIAAALERAGNEY